MICDRLRAIAIISNITGCLTMGYAVLKALDGLRWGFSLEGFLSGLAYGLMFIVFYYLLMGFAIIVEKHES